MKSSRVTQVRAGRCAAMDLRTLGCEVLQGASLSDYWISLSSTVLWLWTLKSVLKET